jgi:drug/metabolite transporter (DMT)-like permease
MSLSTAPTRNGPVPDTPSSIDSNTVVASPSSWRQTLIHSEEQPPPASTQSYLDVPSFRPSLDSTYSELTELSLHSTELHHQFPLIRSPSHDAGSLTQHDAASTSRFRAAWTAFLEMNTGALLVLAAQGFGTGMNISARMLETPGAHGEPMHPFQILFVRQSITAFICTAYGMYTKTIPDFPFGMRGVRWLLILRGVTGFLGVFGMYFSLLYLPLSEATVLGFLSPILTCYLCSFIMPGETFTAQQQIAGFVSLIGVLFIARPASLLSLSTTSPSSSDSTMPPPSNSTVPTGSPQEVTQQQHLAAVGIAMIGVVGGTGALTAIRVIGTRVHAFISINYFSVWCSLVSLACLIIFPDVKFRLPGNITEWGLLAVLGLCGFVMQFLLTAGLAYGGPCQDEEVSQPTRQSGGRKLSDPESIGSALFKPKPKPSGTRATAMCYTQMLFALGGDKLIFGTTPDTMSWIGSGLILAGAVWVATARDTASKDKKRADAPDTSGLSSVLGRLRRQNTGKGGDTTHEEAVGLMAGPENGDEYYQEDDEQNISVGRGTASNTDKVTESLEMHELLPTRTGS